MFLKESCRFKNGKEHRYWSLVENRRVDGGRKVVQRHVLYLGEINSSQQAAWRKTIEIFEAGAPRARTVALFPEERAPRVAEENIVRIRLDQLELRRPRQWGACWLASELYQKLQLDEFWSQRLHGYSRDKRPDCVQVVIALIVTPEGFPLGYEVLPGNTVDNQTLGGALERIQEQYGKARRVWVMDRGIPTEERLTQMRSSDPPVSYLVGTPKGRLSQLEADLADRPWQEVREGITVKLLPRDGECYVFAQSSCRVDKERAMRRRQLKKLWRRLHELREFKGLKRDVLLMKLGAARAQSPSAWRLVAIRVPRVQEEINAATFSWRLRKAKLRQVRRGEGRYLLRTNLTEEDPAKLWQYYVQLTQVEEAFKNLKGDLGLRPIYHQREDRIEAHIFVAFLSYCLHVTLRRWLRDLAPGLTPRSVLEKFAAVQMIDVHLPTTDGHQVVLSRYTQPERELQVILDQLKLSLPEQPPPRITSAGTLAD